MPIARDLRQRLRDDGGRRTSKGWDWNKPASPTMRTVLRRLGDAFQRSRLTPRVAGILRTILCWMR